MLNVGPRAAALLALCLPLLVEANPLIVHAAWMREVPPSSPVGAIYLDVENPGSVACPITGVSIAPPFSASLHQSVHAGERVQMQAIEAIPLGAGERLNFINSGHHFMIDFGGERAPAPGTALTLEISTCEGAIPIKAEVRSDSGGGEHHHH